MTVTFTADEHPSAEVIGVDLAPTQPRNVPPNLKYILDDIENDWGCEESPFDFLHARFLAGTIKACPVLMKQAYE